MLNALIKDQTYFKHYQLTVANDSVPIEVQFHVHKTVKVPTVGIEDEDFTIDAIQLLLSDKQLAFKIKTLVLSREHPEEVNLLPFIKPKVITRIGYALRIDINTSYHLQNVEDKRLGFLNILDVRNEL